MVSSPLFIYLLFFFGQLDRPDAPEGPEEKSLSGRDREPRLAAGCRPLPGHQVQHSAGVAQEPVRGGTQQHHPAHGAGRHRRPRGHRRVSRSVS